MAKWIKETFPLEMPDFYLSQERSLGLVEDWVYEGPRKIAVFVWRGTNLLDFNMLWHHLPEDEEEYAKAWEFLTIQAGLDMYPAEVTFEKDPLLLAACVQRHVLQEDVPLQKEYYEDGSFSIQPTDTEFYKQQKAGVYKPERKNNWLYAHSWPTTPLHTISVAGVTYDPDKGEWVKPYPYTKPHIQPHEFAYFYYESIKNIEEYINNVQFEEQPPEYREKILKYRDELKNVQEKYKKFYDKPWMIYVPPDPRTGEDGVKNYENWVLYDDMGTPIFASQRMLTEMADDVNMEVPEGLLPGPDATATVLPFG